jgi:TldD protein
MNELRELIPYLSDAVFEMERDLPYAAALALEREGEQITSQTRIQTVEALDSLRGAVLTGFTGRCFLECALNAVSPYTIKPAAERLVKVARELGIYYDGPLIDPGPAIKQSFFVHAEIPPESLSLQDKVDHCRQHREHLQALNHGIVNAVFQYSTMRQREVFVNRSKELYQNLKRTQAVASIVMSHGRKSVSLHEGHAYQGGWEHAGITVERFNTLVEDCAQILQAERLDPGFYECVFAPEFSGIFAHEAFGHGTEADMMLKRQGRGALFLNKQVASPLVNMFDDPTLPGQAASYFFDHEGQLSAPTQIIREGILVHPLTDLNSALRLNITRTANGRRESYANKSYARMTNTFFEAGQEEMEDMISSISSGFLLDRPSNGMEDPKGWGIQLEGFMAREIRNGKLTGKVFSPVIVTGYVPDLLQSIDMVGKHLHISGLGTCGKGHKEWVKVTDGGPYLKLRARLG